VDSSRICSGCPAWHHECSVRLYCTRSLTPSGLQKQQSQRLARARTFKSVCWLELRLLAKKAQQAPPATKPDWRGSGHCNPSSELHDRVQRVQKGLERFISDRQGYLFPFLLLFTGFDLLLDSFAGLGRKDRTVRVRILEFSLMMIRQTAPYIVMALMFGWLWAIALWFAMMMTFGFFMGAAFAPNHKGMPLVEKDSKLDSFPDRF